MNGERYYRQITTSVIRFYLEFEGGILPYDGNGYQSCLIDYRLDVERILDRELAPGQKLALLYIHRDGLRQPDALSLAGIVTERPYYYVAALEIKLGRIFERKNMLDFLSYLRR